MNPARLRWYAARLAAMSPPEVLHRVREMLLKRQFRHDRRGWDRFASGQAPALAELDFLKARLAAGAPCAQAGTEQTLAGQYAGLGHSVDGHVGPAAFLIDPVSRTAWQGAQAYCFDVDVRSTGTGRGDVKFVWEINRLQMLHPLAAQLAATGDERLAERAFSILRTWADANPPFRGVNWFSGIELAMRLVSITLVVAAAGPRLIDDDRRALIGRLVAAHAFWLHRYPSRYSSANNHLVAEGLGLLLAGILVPGAEHAAAYSAEGRAILEHEALRQILPDGVGAEQSPTYQAFTMEMIGLAALIAEGTGCRLAPAVLDRLAAGAMFLKTMMDDTGACPHIGDDDEGRVIAMPPDREPRYVASVVAAMAGLTGRKDLSPPARDPHLRDAVFDAPDDGAPVPEGIRVFADGGYSVARFTQGGRNAVLAFDHGPLGYLKLSAHGHADTLAVWLSLDDQPVLVDAGTYLYHSGGTLRTRLRASLAHNTLTIDERSSSTPSAAFSWSHRAQGRLDAQTGGPWWSLTASHDGYVKAAGVRHERTVAREPGGVLITDRLVGAARPVEVRIGYLLHPALTCRIEGATAAIEKDGIRLVTLGLPAGLRALVVSGDAETGRGLCSQAFGSIGTSQHLVLAGTMTAEPVTTQVVIATRP